MNQKKGPVSYERFAGFWFDGAFNVYFCIRSWTTSKSLNIVKVYSVRGILVCLLRDLEGACWFGIDELSPEPPWPLIQSECLHVHCFLAMIYYRVQAVVCAVTAWIKLCHSYSTAAAVLFSGRSETLRGEDISLICRVWSLYLNVDWVRRDEGRLGFLVHSQRQRKGTREWDWIGLMSGFECVTIVKYIYLIKQIKGL